MPSGAGGLRWHVQSYTAAARASLPSLLDQRASPALSSWPRCTSREALSRSVHAVAEEDLRVTIDDLRLALGRILDAMEDKHGTSVDLGVDYYWMLDDEAAFNMVDKPELHLEVGQLSDDLEELTGFLQRDPDEDVIIWHDLGHVCGLLRRLAALDLPR